MMVLSRRLQLPLYCSLNRFFFFFGRRYGRFKNGRYLIVTLGWILIALTGTIPYIMTGVIPKFTSSFFETMSGYTTTGATIIDKLDCLPKEFYFGAQLLIGSVEWELLYLQSRSFLFWV